MMMTVAATTERKTFPWIHGGPTKYLVSFGLSWPHTYRNIEMYTAPKIVKTNLRRIVQIRVVLGRILAC